MKLTLAVFFQLLAINFAFSQTDIQAIRDSIVKEGKKLYKSEHASWYGTDIFMQEFKGDKNTIEGYFSYPDKEDEVCIFFSNDTVPMVLGTVTFSENDKVSYDSSRRLFTEFEKEIHLLHKSATDEINRDTAFFRSYKNTNLNLIPFIEDGERKVYILTGTSVANTVIFGNDYLINFDKQNNVLSKRKLHQNIIPVNYEGKSDEKSVGAVHNHSPETGEFITATDICTIMLYEKLAKWKQHMVVSKKYMSIWNCVSNSLIIIPTGK